jgi:hypothetical protein
MSVKHVLSQFKSLEDFLCKHEYVPLLCGDRLKLVHDDPTKDITFFINQVTTYFEHGVTYLAANDYMDLPLADMREALKNFCRGKSNEIITLNK